MAVITSKDIKLGIKKGYGIPEFCKEYKFENADSFWTAVGKIKQDKNAFRQIERQINANDKKNRQQQRRQAKKEGNDASAAEIKSIETIGMAKFSEPINLRDSVVSVASSETILAITGISPVAADLPVDLPGFDNEKVNNLVSVEANDITAVNVEADFGNNSEPDENSELELLQKKYEEILEMIMSSEKNVRGLNASIESKKRQMESKKQELEKISILVKKKLEEAENLYFEIDEIEKEVSEKKVMISNLNAEKETLSNEIKAKTVKTVNCSSCSVDSDFVLSELSIANSEIQNKMIELMQDTVLDNLMVSQLRMLASILLIRVENFEVILDRKDELIENVLKGWNINVRYC